MGHTEMLLAVAGLDELVIKERSKMLGSSDWSSLKPHVRAELFFARKLTKTPLAIPHQAMSNLAAPLGPDRTVDVLWHLCWCNYMTRVADAFQVPLERDNVFAT